MKTVAFAAMTTLAAGAAFAQSEADRTGWPESFTVGTASQGGTYFAYGSGWANLVGEQLGITGGGEVTGGPMQNMANVHTGNSAFAMTTMGPAADSLAGENPIAPGLMMDKACALFPMYQTPFSAVALSSSGIESIETIPDGARVGFGPAGGTSETYFPRMLDELGVTYDKRTGGYDDLASQLQDGLIDVLAFAAGVPVSAVSQLEVQAPVNIIDFTEEEQRQIADSFPVADFEIPAGSYTSMPEAGRSVAMWNFAIANCDLPESFVEAVVDIVMSDNARMMTIHQAAEETLPENWDKNNAMKWHPGAAKWFRENAGADIPDDMVYSAG